jgi:pimeloyl-[acyl-carrier protein] methyl ester esterase
VLKILLLPGMDGTGDLFEWFIKALPEGFEALPVRYPRDRPLSYSELMRLVEEASPRESFVLLAESFSTPLAIQYAATHPNRLKGLVLCAAFASSPISGLRKSVAKLFAPIMFQRNMPELAIRRWLVGADAPSSLIESVRAAIASVQASVLMRRMHGILACDVRADLQRLSMPVLYLQAAQDRVVHPSALVEILQTKPEIRVARLEGPHLLLQRNPHESAKIVAAFMRELT